MGVGRTKPSSRTPLSRSAWRPSEENGTQSSYLCSRFWLPSSRFVFRFMFDWGSGFDVHVQDSAFALESRAKGLRVTTIRPCTRTEEERLQECERVNVSSRRRSSS